MKRPVVVTLLVGVLANCGPEDVGYIAVQINYPQPVQTVGELRAEPAPPAGQWPDNIITDFRLCVSAADMGKIRCANFNRADYQKNGKASLGGIPVGDNRKVTFQGVKFDENSNHEVYWCGEVSGIRIGKGSTTRVNMFISSCSNFTSTRGNMEVGRVFHTATRMPDGRVLVAGGFFTLQEGGACDQGTCVRLSATNSLELYDPGTGTFVPLTGLQLNAPRGLHTATLLPDGRVLIAGGCSTLLWHKTFTAARSPLEIPDDGWGTAGNSAEIVDISRDQVQMLAQSLPTARAAHGAVLAENTLYLLGGMGTGATPLRSAARFVEASSSFEELFDALQVPRYAFSLVELNRASVSGRWLLWGGNHPDSGQPGAGVFAEVLEEAGGTPQSLLPNFVTADAGRGLPAFHAAAVGLGNDRVLVTGGMLADTAMNPGLSKPEILRRYRMLDLAANPAVIASPPNDSEPKNLMSFFRALHTVTMLERQLSPDDTGYRVLVAGGLLQVYEQPLDLVPQDTAEFFLPWKAGDVGTFGTIQIKGITVHMSIGRAGHTATALGDGTVLLAGGFSGTSTLSITDTAELFNANMRVLRLE